MLQVQNMEAQDSMLLFCPFFQWYCYFAAIAEMGTNNTDSSIESILVGSMCVNTCSNMPFYNDIHLDPCMYT